MEITSPTLGPRAGHPSLRRFPFSSSLRVSSSYRLPLSSLPKPKFPTTQRLTTPVAMSLASSSQPASSPSGLPDIGSEVSSSGLIGENDLLIVGPGVLGRIVAERWHREHPGCQIFGQTMTIDHHEELINIGIKPILRGPLETQKFPYVIFCAPPSRSPDYIGDVRQAASCWSGDGSLLFTSSTAAYDCNDNSPCDEDSHIVPLGRSPRTDVLLRAEEAVLGVGGCVLRLAGLYISSQRGAHVYWLEKGTVDSHPDHVLNLIHYEDAASLSVAVLNKKLRGRIFLGCDNHPLSRRELMDYVNKSGKFSKKFVGFTGTSDPLGKRLSNSKTRAEIGWEPKYTSFPYFLEQL
ncbi:hypothetical protein H6P81_004298 [Aristolochia fimbriata]|uniref:NAD(P)-binding Rossmann-fold superfamily protein n=1 Tax=Aristolochia fimbriata TaxID=158543 RepID=A0AAV7FHD8_ARIFI|nr:hypothetical protein H6P81_004298 [Aristolochia fimbriata]